MSESWGGVRGRCGLWFGLLVVWSLCVAVATGCSDAVIPVDPVVVVFVCPDTDAERYALLAERFVKEHPNTKIDLRPTPWQLLDSAFVAGGADVSVFWPYLRCPLYPGRCQSSPAELRNRGEILDLTPFVDQDETFSKDDFYPGTVDLYAPAGEILALPAGVDPVVMYLNLRLLAKSGSAVPHTDWDWADFLQVASAVQDSAPGVYGYAPSDYILDPAQHAYQHGGRLFDNLTHPTRPTLDDPLTLDILEEYVSLFLEYDIAPGPTDVRRDSFGGTLQAGILLDKAGMWASWFSGRGDHPAGSGMVRKDYWAVVPLPCDTNCATLSRVGGYFISAHASHPEACWRWIMYLTDQLPPNDTIPARIKVAESEIWSHAVGPDAALAGLASLRRAIWLTPGAQDAAGVLWAYASAIESVLGGNETPQQALAEQQRAASIWLESQ